CGSHPLRRPGGLTARAWQAWGMRFNSGDLDWAAGIVGRWVPPTPQYVWPLLAEHVGAEVWVKHENHTPTGAFKVRGGLVYAERLRARAARGQGHRVGDPGQPRPEPGLRRAGRWYRCHDRGPRGQQPGQERGHVRLRR